MTDVIPPSMSLLTMYKLHRLAEVRYRYFSDLRASERWQRYFSQEELDARVRETKAFADYWQQAIDIAQVAADPTAEHKEQPAVPTLPVPPAAMQLDAEPLPLARAS